MQTRKNRKTRGSSVGEHQRNEIPHASRVRYGGIMKVVDIQSWLVDIPQIPPIAPYQSRYRAQSSKESLLFRVATDNGTVGWGEAPQSWIEGVPFDGGEGKKLLEKLRGWDPFDIERLYSPGGLDGGYLQSGIEMAFWDIVGKTVGKPLYQLLGGAVRSKDIELAGTPSGIDSSCGSIPTWGMRRQLRCSLPRIWSSMAWSISSNPCQATNWRLRPRCAAARKRPWD
jgi:hypothetical protein